jgi:hypothetical protein
MTLNIELSSEEELRGAAAARRNGLAPAELARRLVVEQLPSLIEKGEEQAAMDVGAEEATDVCTAGEEAEVSFDWDAWSSVPPRRRTGIILAKLRHAGRARPMPADDPWAV